MNNKTVLCEIAFLEKFLECYPDSPPFPDDKVLQKLKTWIELYAFLSRSNKQLDCSPRSLAEAAQRDKNLAYFWKKSTEGASRLDFSDGFDDLEKLLNAHLFSMLLSGKGKGPIAKKYGIISVNAGNCLTKAHLFIDNGKAVRVDDKWDWNQFEKCIPERASNSMIIVDNYILKNGRRDLPELLNLLLPELCDVDYHLTIFYLPEYGAALTKDDIIEMVSKAKPGLVDRLQLELIPMVSKTDFHDRAIITNNLWFSSGAGFDLTRWDPDSRSNVAKRTTTLEIVYPYLASLNVQKVDDAYENLIKDAKVALEHAKMTSHNRLITGYLD